MFDFSSMLVNGIPLIFVIFALVEFVKSLGVKGSRLTLLSLVFGMLFGAAYQVSISGLPGDFAGWFSLVVFGLTLGLVTSGFYKWSDGRFPTVKG